MAGKLTDSDRVKEAIKASEGLPAEKRVLLLQVLSSLEGEIQARDVTLGVLKSECLKNLVSQQASSNNDPPTESCNYLQDPSFALLRDGLFSPMGRRTAAAQSNRASASRNASPNPDSHDIHFMRVQTSLFKHKNALKKSLMCLRESERQREECVKELNTLKEKEKTQEESESKKNIEKKKKKDEKDKEEEEKPNPKIESLENTLKEEKKQKMQMVSVLLNDRKQIAMKYLEEKNRTDQLSRLLKEERKKSQKLSLELEEESKRSLSMEAETEIYLRQIEKLQEDNKKNLLDERRKGVELEEILRRTKQEAEHLRKQLAEAHRVAMSQASVPVMPPPPTQSQISSVNTSSRDYNQSDMGSLGKTSKLKNDMPDMDKNDYYGTSIRSGQQSSTRNTSMNARGAKTDLMVTSTSPSASSVITSTSGNNTVINKKAHKGIVPPPVPPNKPNLGRSYPLVGQAGGSNTHDHNCVGDNNRKIRYINE